MAEVFAAQALGGGLTVATTATTGNGVAGGANGRKAGVPLPASPILGQGTPTARELAREQFVAKFAGLLVTLPPHFTDQSKILYLRGLGTAPRFFLHGDYTLALALPPGSSPRTSAAPSTSPPTRPASRP